MNDEENIKSNQLDTSKLLQDKTKHISIRDASIITGINDQSLRKLGDGNKTKCYKTLSSWSCICNCI